MVRKKSRDQDGHREDEAYNFLSELAIVVKMDETFFSPLRDPFSVVSPERT
jgi:hypothetical protein